MKFQNANAYLTQKGLFFAPIKKRRIGEFDSCVATGGVNGSSIEKALLCEEGGDDAKLPFPNVTQKYLFF